MNNLNFSITNSKKFPIISILNNLPAKHSLFETAIISINDFLVDKFLKKKINFVDISKIFLRLLNSKSYLKYKKIYPRNINDIILLNNNIIKNLLSKKLY